MVRFYAAILSIIVGIFALAPVCPSSAAAQVTFPDEQTATDPTGAPGHKPPGFGEVLTKMLPMFLMVFLIFYFMVLKPQQQKLKAQKDLVSSLKKGDSVVTTGGIIGKVAQVESDFVLVEIASNVRVKFEPAHISRKVEKSASEKAAA